jgi:peptide/nickel transport system substrate-binding protein
MLRIRRRTLLQTSLATLAAPAIAQPAATLRVIPEADLAILDPIWTTATVTRDHAFMVFDTLYGRDTDYIVRPQMAAGDLLEDTTWTIRLRDDLRFHDGTPVLARDVIASIRRWGARASFGQTLLEATDAIEAPDDRTIRFRMKRRFPVPMALADSAIIMPERLARTDAFTQVTEMTGSGPFRFVAAERLAGVRNVYERFAGYVPRPDGTPSGTAGPKIVHVDRVIWTTMPDAGTAASAMLAGEMDWWEVPPDFMPQLRASPKLYLKQIDTLGGIRVMRFNHLHPPFDNPAIRRALLPAISQAEVMTAFTSDTSLWRDHVGVFTPNTPMSNEAGIEVLAGPRSLAAARAALAAAGYRGERVVVLNPADQPEVSSNTLVGCDIATKVGFNIDIQTMDWGTMLARRAKTDPADKGGWNLSFTGLSGSGCLDPSSHIALRGNGLKAWAGWPTSPRIEELRLAWFDAPSLAAQQAICIDIQKQFWIDLPYIPLGQRLGVNAFNKRVTDVPVNFPLFYGLKLT